MLNFSNYLAEEKAKPVEFGSLKSDPKGKLHEILVGYHLRNGIHMEKHPDIEGRSPKEVHDEIAKQLGGVNSKQYKNFSERARKAAEDIKKQLGISDEDIANVQWTSKEGDIQRATGIPSSQKEDDSDIMITTKKGQHHGVSLKVSDDNKPITLSNNGAEATYGGKKIYDNHQEELKRDYPVLNKDGLRGNAKVEAKAREKQINANKENIPEAELRKAWLRLNPKETADIKKRNLSTLTSAAKNMHEQISSLTPEQRVNHIRHLVLHAYSTPKEALGHTHIRHFTGGGQDPVMQTTRPSQDFEHYLSEPDRIFSEHRGTSVYYHYKTDDGKSIPFAMQTLKFSSQSDPLSSLTVVGKDVKNKKDLPIHEAIKAAYQSKKSKTASDPAPVAPEKKVTSQHIKTDHPMLRKPLSQFRERIPEISRRIPQTDSPFASMPSPGVKRPPVSRKLSPEGIPEHMPQAHRENSIGGYQDSGI